jgi:DNA-binding NtrC family response regulator
MKQILLVDDNNEYAELLAEFLELNGLSSHISNSGKDAIKWLKEFNCQAIVTDILMSNGTGIDLIRWNANQPTAVPLMAMSGTAELSHKKEISQFCEIMGVPFLEKPISFEALLKLLEPITLQTV